MAVGFFTREVPNGMLAAGRDAPKEEWLLREVGCYGGSCKRHLF
jgi:hypothetical protein